MKKAGSKGWVAAGDAVCSFDPLSSMGIGHALSSGIRAGIIARQQLMEEKDYTDVYTRDVIGNFSNYMAIRSKFYQSETRWKSSKFWYSRV